jgi:proteasome assembly chaperone (PAC2) family protein
MNVSKKEVRGVEKAPVEIYQTCQLQNPFLLISWKSRDIGKLASKVIDFLIEKMGGQEIAKIKPLGFFSFGGVRFKEDLVQAPESQFWACEKNNLLIFRSDEPEFEHYQFLNTILELAEDHGQVKELYTLSGTISFTAHTHPRRILTVFNQPELKERLQGYGLDGVTWEGPPAISSYLLWVAQRRGIPGVSLWPEIPFYLAGREDPQAMKLILSFLNRRCNFDLDLGKLNLEIEDQNDRIVQLRRENAEIDQYINRLESGLQLDEEEQLKLVQKVYEILGKRG